MIYNYFTEIHQTIIEYASIISKYEKIEKIYSQNKGHIRGKIKFHNGYILSFMELKDINKFAKNKYSYHFMNHEQELIFRYDNAEHYKNLSTFPHHKHLPQKVVKSKEPNLEDILLEICQYISK